MTERPSCSQVSVWWSPRVHRRSLGLRFRFLWPFRAISVPLAFSSEVKGWRLMIADARTPFPSDLSAAEPHRAKREPGVRRAKAPGLAERTGESIRRPARIRSLHQARSGSSLWPADGRQPFMPKSISRSLPSKAYPFRFAHARRMRPLLSGASRAPFIQRGITIARSRLNVKKLAPNTV
jgi:hypothetical protein